ncbi:MAG: GNAT family N-acetyltransferase [Pyrinomonadaceae bacterium]|nr:GNAT family N-acetyltransferase [Pyrinomonadaceae bacterium]
MKSLKVPMTVDEFELAEYPFGWKDEYCDGFAYYTPRDHGVLMKISVESRVVENSVEIKPASETTIEKLVKLFYESFVDSVEFCNLSKKRIKERAAENVEDYFEGRRGIPVSELSRIAVTPDNKQNLIGACLVSKYKYGYKNEIIFVSPAFQKRGVGTSLAANLLNELHEIGEKVLWSEHHICNIQSERWHKKFGFEEVTDIMTAKFRRNFYRHEVWRGEQLTITEKINELKSNLSKAETEVERLEAIEKDDFSAAWLRWKYDF